MSAYSPNDKLAAYGIKSQPVPKAALPERKKPRIGYYHTAVVTEGCAEDLVRLAASMAAQANALFDEGDQKSASFTRIQSEGVKEAAKHLSQWAKKLYELDADMMEDLILGYGRIAPEGIPQEIWDKAVAEWMEDDSTVDKDVIMRISQATDARGEV